MGAETEAPTAATWRDLLAIGRALLPSESEARWILEEVSGHTWPELLLENPPIHDRTRRRFDELVAKRRGGEPLQYVLGHWPFRTLDLMVDHRVLIPRPETEQVVEVALRELDRLFENAAGSPGHTVVDLGTGSGAIALSIAAERPQAHVWATDVSQESIDVASANLAGLGGFAAARVRISHGTWWSALPAEVRGTVDLVVSNPPYVSSDEMATIDPVVAAWEPRLALESGPSGLEAIDQILASAPSWLCGTGVAVIEIAPHQATEAARLAEHAGFADVKVEPDLAGRERALVARMASKADRR